MSGGKSSFLGIIGIIFGIIGIGMGLLSYINVQTVENTISDDKWYDPFFIYGLYGATEYSHGWSAPSSDIDAAFYALFVIPQNRDDWKVCIIHRLTMTIGLPGDLSGILTAGATGNGDLISYFNIFNSVNLDLEISEQDRIYHTYSSTFSAIEGDLMRVGWQKDDALGGSGAIYISFALVHN